MSFKFTGRFSCASGSAVQSFAWENGESHVNLYPKIVDVSVESRTGHTLTTSQALLLDRTCFCNQKGVFGAAPLGELCGIKQQEYGDSISVRPSLVSEICWIFMKFGEGVLYKIPRARRVS